MAIDRISERAKTSLNRILLVLNTGLTKIISTLLRKNNGVDNEDMIRELMSLSERSVRDSVTELEGFRVRLESMSSLALSVGGYSSVGRDGAVVSGRKRYTPQVQGKSVGGIMDRQKGNAAKQAGGARTATHKQNVNKASSNTSATKTKRSTNPKRVKDSQEIHPVWVRSKNSSTTSIHLRRMNGRPKAAEGEDQTGSRSQPPRTAPSVSTSPPALELLTAIPARHQLPALQAQVPHTMPDTLLDRRISMLSHSSGSTKIGEIPQYKWINQWIPPVEVDEESLEDDGHEAGDDEDSGRTGMRFWRRFGRNRA